MIITFQLEGACYNWVTNFETSKHVLVRLCLRAAECGIEKFGVRC